jgi:hypothetical protein
MLLLLLLMLLRPLPRTLSQLPLSLRRRYNRLKVRFETESNTRAVAEESIIRLREEYEKLQQSSELRVQQLLRQIRSIERDRDNEFTGLALAQLVQRLASQGPLQRSQDALQRACGPQCCVSGGA